MDYYYIALIIFIFLSILIVLFYDYYYNRENFIILKNEHIYYEREVRRKVKNNNLNNIRTYPSDIKEYSYSEPIYIENNLNSNDNNYNENDDDNIIEKNDEKINTNNNNLTKYENELIDQEYSNENIIKTVEKINKKKKEIEKAQNNKVDKNEIKNEDTEIIIDGISCSQKNGSTIIGFSNNKNLMYISHDYGKNWIKKELPKNNKWSKIYLLEVRKNKFKIILFGTEKNIFLSTNNGDFWNHISTLKGHDLIHSEDYNYIYISTNNGILINNNEGLISSDTIGCINECKGIDNYINNYDGIYKFKIINDPNVKNKNINSIACTPDGNIIIVAINNEKIKVGKIKKEQEPRYINKKEEDRENARWKYQYKESDKNLDNYEDEYGNLIWNFYEILETNNDITSIGVAEGIKKSGVIFGTNKSFFEYTYDKTSNKKLEEIKRSNPFDTYKIKCNAMFPCPDLKQKIELPNYLVSKILVYKIGYLRSIYLIINNLYILHFDIVGKKRYLEKINIGNYFIKDLVINKNGLNGYLLLSNGKIYINNNLKDFFSEDKAKKSNFVELKIKINNTS